MSSFQTIFIFLFFRVFFTGTKLTGPFKNFTFEKHSQSSGGKYVHISTAFTSSYLGYAGNKKKVGCEEEKKLKPGAKRLIKTLKGQWGQWRSSIQYIQYILEKAFHSANVKKWKKLKKHDPDQHSNYQIHLQLFSVLIMGMRTSTIVGVLKLKQSKSKQKEQTFVFPFTLFLISIVYIFTCWETDLFQAIK